MLNQVRVRGDYDLLHEDLLRHQVARGPSAIHVSVPMIETESSTES